MSETDLRFVILFRYLKTDLCVFPLALVFCKFEIIVQHQPNHFLIRNDFNQFYFTVMNILVVIGVFIVKFGSTSLNILRPPSANIIECVKDFFWSLVYQNGSGKISALTINGDKASVTVIKEGLRTPTAVEPAGDTLWIAERGAGQAVSIPMPK